MDYHRTRLAGLYADLNTALYEIYWEAFNAGFDAGVDASEGDRSLADAWAKKYAAGAAVDSAIAVSQRNGSER